MAPVLYFSFANLISFVLIAAAAILAVLQWNGPWAAKLPAVVLSFLLAGYVQECVLSIAVNSAVQKTYRWWIDAPRRP